VAAACGTAASATLPAQASAPDETVDGDVAVMEGVATLQPGLAVIGGFGSWSFASGLACVVVSASGTGGEAGERTPDVEASHSCSATASGQYFNVVCGTGVAGGSGSMSEGEGSDTYTASAFDIAFFAGVGVLQGQATESEADGGGAAGAQPLYGLVVLVPDAVPPADQCTDSFAAVADIATTA
jgi:hypothetical protein